MDRLFGRIRWLLVAATALAGFSTLLWMTHTLTWVGQAQSYDTMLYARSLWGAGHGHWHNPIVGTHALAIHGHFLALALAPLTHLFRAVDVLNVAHSLSAGVALAVMVNALARTVAPAPFERPHSTPDSDAPADLDRLALPAWLTDNLATITLTCLATALLCSPLLLNPFTFGSRPDSLGIPLLVIAAARAHSAGLGDRIALACLAGGLLAREEYVFFVVGLAACTPWRVLAGDTIAGWRQRAVVATLAIGWWLVYWLALRDVFGGEFATSRAQGAPTAFLGPRFLERFIGLWSFKLEIVLCALTFGGVAWLGWRRLPAAAGGLLMLLAMNRLGERALVFHYGFFLLPGLCAMTLDGAQRLQSWHTRQRLAAIFVGAGAAIAMGTLSSSTPVGGRYERVFFDPSFRDRPYMANLHDELGAIPPDAALIIPWQLGAAFADREFIGRLDHYERDAEHLQGVEWTHIFAEGAIQAQ